MQVRIVVLMVCTVAIVALAWAGCSGQAGGATVELKYVLAAIRLVGDRALDGSLAVYPGKRVKGEILAHSLVVQPEKNTKDEIIVTLSERSYSGLPAKRMVTDTVVGVVTFKGASVEVKPQPLVLSADPKADAILSRVVVAAMSEGVGPRAACGPINISITKTAKDEYFVMVSRIPGMLGAHWGADVVSKNGQVKVLRKWPGM